MALIVKNKSSRRSVVKSVSNEYGGYTCIGSYEDKPKNRVYYFLHSEDDLGTAGKYDCIVEYDQLSSTNSIVYQDGRYGSNRVAENVLNFSKSHLITGVDKVDDFLYWTDNLNRPRKINVEKAKANEGRINTAPMFQSIFMESGGHSDAFNKVKIYASGRSSVETTTQNAILAGVTSDTFKKGDNIYVQQFLDYFNDNNMPYNGYSEVIGIVKPFSEGTSISASGNIITGTSSAFLDDFNPGDYFCISLGFSGGQKAMRFYQIREIVSQTELRLGFDWQSAQNVSYSSVYLNLQSWSAFNADDIPVNKELRTDFAIITNTPINLPSADGIDSTVTSPGGRIFYANPDDAYSPIVSYGTYQDKIRYLDALSHQPKDRPRFHFSDNKSKTNHLVGKFFQFRTRYIYDDGTTSAYSGISNVANQEAYSRVVTQSNIADLTTALDNTINIEYQNSTSNVDKIEIVARDGNDGEFFLVDVVNNNFINYLKKRKNEELIPTSGNYFGGNNQSGVQFSSIPFRNDGVYAFVSKEDLNKLQDAVPKKAKAQTILPKNRIAYGNVVDGHDNTDIYCDIVISNSGYIDSQEQKIHFSVTQLQGSAGPDSDVKFSLMASNADASSFAFPGLIDVDGSLGDKPIKIELSWTKLLFQNHNQNSDAPSTFIPRSGKLVLSTSVRNPTSPEDVAVQIVDAINNGSYEVYPESFTYKYTTPTAFVGMDSPFMQDQYSDFLGFDVSGGGYSVLDNIEFFSAPTSISAEYTSLNRLVINLTYSKNTQKEESTPWLQILGPNSYLEISNPNITYPENSGESPSRGDLAASGSYYKKAHHFGKSYKTGANHSFGLVYFDETNRCSSVNKMKPVNNYNSGTEVYSPFYPELNSPQNYFNSAFFKIYHKPPVWATHYQWVYAGNTSIDRDSGGAGFHGFIQIPIQNAYKGSEGKIFLGLGSLKTLDHSYNEETPSILDYNFAEGDRVRFISKGIGVVNTTNEDKRHYFKKHIDVPIISYDLYDQADIESATTSAGSDLIEGHYIVIQDPSEFDDAGDEILVPTSDENSSELITPGISISRADLNHKTIGNGYHRLIVEIYRPKKIVPGVGTEAFYEVGDKIPIENPGTESRTHQGQPNNFFFDTESGMMVTAKQASGGPVDVNGDPTFNFAGGVLNQGDVYIKQRDITWYQETSEHTREKILMNCESYYISDFYNSNNWNKGRINITNPYAEERRLPASVYYSDTYSSTTNYNGLSTFNMQSLTSPYYDYNQDFGSIQHLAIKGDDLIIFHENKVGRALVGKNILKYADGDSNLALSNDVLSDYAQVYSGNHGCSLNPESVVKYKDRFYFVDIKRGAILRLGGDGITRISDYGLSDYIRDKGELYVMFDPETSTDGEFKIVAGYDPKYDEYVVTFSSIIDKEESLDNGLWGSTITNWDTAFSVIKTLRPSSSESAVTIAYNDSLKKWTSFYSYIPEFYAKINRQLITFKNGELYMQNSPFANFNTFYGQRDLSSIDFVFNASPSSVKSYNAISLESDTKLLAEMSTNMGQYNNSYQNVVSTFIGFRPVKETINIIEGESYINGSEDSNFYEDLSPGDLIKITNKNLNNLLSTEGSPIDVNEYRVVTKILTKTKIEIDSSVDLTGTFKLEVIDYKTKEGTQYSQIPFAPSQVNNYDNTDFEGDYDGDASNIFGLGTFTPEESGNIAFLEDTASDVIKNLPFKGDKRVNVSDKIIGGNYLSVTSGRSSINRYTRSLGSNILDESTSNFSDSSKWTVVSPGAVIQKDTSGQKGNVALFKHTVSTGGSNDADWIAEIKTSYDLSFVPGKKYRVSFDLDALGYDDGDAELEIKLGGNTGYKRVSTRQISVPKKVRKSISIIAGGKDSDPQLHIRSLDIAGTFNISNLRVQLDPEPEISSNKNRKRSSEGKVFPAEYALYCLDTATGVSTHEGWVYNITDEKVEYKLLNSSTRNSGGSSSGYGGNSGSRSRLGSKFYFIVKDGFIDGEKLKGHYLKTKLTSHWYQSKNKFNLYSANVDVDKSELSGNK